MGLADEISELQKLKVAGVLSDDEFASAKKSLINQLSDLSRAAAAGAPTSRSSQ